MAFYARSFTFGGSPCEIFGNLRIFDIDLSANKTSSLGSEAEIMQTWVYRKPKAYYHGRTLNTPLEFDITFGSDTYFPASFRNVVDDWLFAKMGYMQLQILQDDLMDCYFNVILTKGKAVYIGNLQYAFTAHAVCDAPWAWGFTQTLTKTYTSGGIISDSLIFNNLSASADYLYPTIAFTLNSVGNGITITNYSDSNRAFVFTGLSALETVTVNNDLQLMVSSTGLYRLSKFNNNWLRFIPKYNSLNITGGLSSYTLTYQFAKKVGA